MLTQRLWRTMGAASISLAALMAVFAVTSGIMRESVLHIATLMADQPPDNFDPARSGYFHIVFWLGFSLLILVSLYCALLDMRYIRLQYLLQRRDIYSRTLGDQEFRETLLKTQGKGK